MYTLKVSYGYLVEEFEDERETETVEVLGTYEDEDEALKAAASKFDEALEVIDDIEIRFGEVKESPYRYYVTYGAIDEYYTLIYGYNQYYEVVVEEAH